MDTGEFSTQVQDILSNSSIPLTHMIFGEREGMRHTGKVVRPREGLSPYKAAQHSVESEAELEDQMCKA